MACRLDGGPLWGRINGAGADDKGAAAGRRVHCGATMSARPVRFGALLRQADNRWSSIAESARICDDLGFHSIHVIDHLLAIPDPTGDILESWTTLTACAAITRRVRLSANVLCNAFRAPALLAKMGATLDVISDGRFELAMGAGWHEPEFHAYGFDFPPPGTRVAQLGEAVGLIKRLWTGERVDIEGRYYRVRGGLCRPRPVQCARTLSGYTTPADAPP